MGRFLSRDVRVGRLLRTYCIWAKLLQKTSLNLMAMPEARDRLMEAWNDCGNPPDTVETVGLVIDNLRKGNALPPLKELNVLKPEAPVAQTAMDWADC